MYPVLLDLAELTVIVVGNGREAARRIGLLDDAKPRDLRVFSDQPSQALELVAASRLIRRMPTAEDIPARSILFIGDLSDERSAELVALGRAAGALVNVEDKIGMCDFHSTTPIRRGDLIVTVSTGGRSPGLAARLKRYLEQMIGPEWSERLERMTMERTRWRQAGLDHAEVKRLTSELIDREGWLTLPDQLNGNRTTPPAA
jgi:precorrin-2 dehydrogenase/sirohydrochlorin ferrochelatase